MILPYSIKPTPLCIKAARREKSLSELFTQTRADSAHCGHNHQGFTLVEFGGYYTYFGIAPFIVLLYGELLPTSSVLIYILKEDEATLYSHF